MYKLMTLLSSGLLVAFSPKASAGDLEFIAETLRQYSSHCQQVFEDPRAYAAGLPERQSDGTPSVTFSPDGKALSISNEVGAGSIEAFVDTLSDREIRHCAYYVTVAGGWNVTQISQAYVPWIKDNVGLEIIGGLSPIYGYEHYRHTLLGVWPPYGISVQTNIHENEFQVLSTRILK